MAANGKMAIADCQNATGTFTAVDITGKGFVQDIAIFDASATSAQPSYFELVIDGENILGNNTTIHADNNLFPIGYLHAYNINGVAATAANEAGSFDMTNAHPSLMLNINLPFQSSMRFRFYSGNAYSETRASIRYTVDA